LDNFEGAQCGLSHVQTRTKKR